MPWPEVLPMDDGSQATWNGHAALDERLIDHQAGGIIGEAVLLPNVDLLFHRLEMPLHPADTDVDHLLGIEMGRVLARDGREVAVKRQVVADEDLVADGQAQRERLVMAV